MRSLLKDFQRCKRAFIAHVRREICCVNEAAHAIGPLLRAALLLSNDIRRDACISIMFRLGGASYLLLATGSRVRGLRADYYSLSGYVREVLRRGRFGGSRIAAIPPGIDALRLCREVREVLAKTRNASTCIVLDADREIEELVNAIVLVNMVLDRLEVGHKWAKKLICRSE